MIRAVVLTLLAGTAGAQEVPHGGQDGREIASLSAEDVAALEAGEGWGLARSAELNGHPGPAHLLEHAEALALSGDQRRAVQASFDAMNAESRTLGGALIAAEARLDAAFEAGGLDEARLEMLVGEAEEARGRLRARHLTAHLEVTPLLSPHQIATYARLRGYDAAAPSGHGGH